MSSNAQESLPLEPEQRPNAVIRNGGPQLLRGLILPMPPSSNRYWEHASVYSRKRRKYTAVTYVSKEAKAYRLAIAELALIKRFRFWTEKSLYMKILVCPPANRGDCHNYGKVLLDAMQDAGVFVNDSQVEVEIRRGPVINGGRVVVSLWEITPDRQALLTSALRGDA